MQAIVDTPHLPIHQDATLATAVSRYANYRGEQRIDATRDDRHYMRIRLEQINNIHAMQIQHLRNIHQFEMAEVRSRTIARHRRQGALNARVRRQTPNPRDIPSQRRRRVRARQRLTENDKPLKYW